MIVISMQRKNLELVIASIIYFCTHISPTDKNAEAISKTAIIGTFDWINALFITQINSLRHFFIVSHYSSTN